MSVSLLWLYKLVLSLIFHWIFIVNRALIILFTSVDHTIQVVFRVVMFRPYVGEIIAAKLKCSNSKGLQCEFFNLDSMFIQLK